MNKRVFAALAACILILALSGCQLALPEKTNTEDKLCGLFITFEALPTPADEAGKTFNSMAELEEYLQTPSRIYATPHEGRDGSQTPDYIFEGVKGIRFFEMYVKDEKSNYFTSQADAGIEDIHVGVADGSIELTGTLLVDIRQNSSICSIFANPVYSTPDGQVYVEQGSAVSYDRTDAGDWGSTSISRTNTQTINAEKTSETYKIELKIKGVYTLKKAVFKQMNASDELLAQTQITKENAPENILLETETAYSILEEYRLDAYGNTVIDRSLIKNDADEFTCSFTGADGFVDARVVKLEKPSSVAQLSA